MFRGAVPQATEGDWTAAEKEQIRDALGIDGDKTAATGGQIQTIITTGGPGPWTTGSGGSGGDLTSILGTNLSETQAGNLAGAFVKLLDVQNPGPTLNELALGATLTDGSVVVGTNHDEIPLVD